ncbi:hypothetical protein D8Y22_00890 [Salinadaptatus halalkaliphilus]|uniref:Uncharacterized protein n=1 Tax=Salinadaptatus halalkaliphilus TaxID=2419781 RepID=A0A4S3TTH2_9EURY|nr:hypothetical protein [Salinadaptatus halalkaliphilus]THE66713.1 hypothetical protein D8Y22_00890 [Salinadaptatus halalkaliphilus]
MGEQPYERFIDLFSETPVKIYDHAPPDNVQEANIVSGIIGRLREDESVWARREVNLWEMIEVLDGRQRPDAVGKQYQHPIQPDIDLLYCETDGATQQSPLVAVEAKHFAKQTGDGRVMPKLRSNDGFYAGLGQALSLLLMGVEYVFLAHFVSFHPDYWNGENQNDLMTAHRTVTNLYARSICRLIDAFDLPIGYIAAGTRPAADAIAAYPVTVKPPTKNPFVDTTSGNRIRGLLYDSYNSLGQQ